MSRLHRALTLMLAVAASAVPAAPLAQAQSSPGGDEAMTAAPRENAAAAAVQVYIDAADVGRAFETVFSTDPDQVSAGDEQRRIAAARATAIAAGADAVIVGSFDKAPQMGPESRGLQKRLQPGSVVGIKFTDDDEKKKKGKKRN